jgi:hypothetical protein
LYALGSTSAADREEKKSDLLVAVLMMQYLKSPKDQLVHSRCMLTGFKGGEEREVDLHFAPFFVCGRIGFAGRLNPPE